MEISGASLVGGQEYFGKGAFHAMDARTGVPLEPPIGNAQPDAVRQACALAERSFDPFRQTTASHRADFLQLIAQEIATRHEGLIERADLETGLGVPRLRGELDRTLAQLRMFAELARGEDWVQPIRDPALPDRQPVPRPDLRQRRIPIGPVAVFGASNFPLAFSVAGGDTAAALAAGCPVVVKGHPAHPGTAEIVGRAIRRAVILSGMPQGVFSLLQGEHLQLGAQLTADPAIKAIAFTGSRSGGVTLMALAARRLEPIPVFAEMSSVNPVVLMKNALAARGASLAEGFVQSLNLGAGQFCTNPGIVFALAGPALDRFLETADALLGEAVAQPMLTDNIRERFLACATALGERHDVRLMGQADQSDERMVSGRIFVVEAAAFLSDPELRQEIFGPSSVVVLCDTMQKISKCLEMLEGQLTATIQMDDADEADAVSLLPLLEKKAGRIIVNGWPTGVEVCSAMVHGGPFPATADGRSTSVGSTAIERFLRPICYQNLPSSLLPAILRD